MTRLLYVFAQALLCIAPVCLTPVRAESIYIASDESEGIRLSDRSTDSRLALYLHRAESTPFATRLVTGQRGNAALHAKGDAMQPLFDTAANTYGVHPDLLRAVAEQESRYNPKAISPKGAMGVMQLMPATSRQYGVKNAFDPVENINAGARYLRAMLDEFEGDQALALSAYNAGPNRVRTSGNKIPPIPETQAYVPSVMRTFAQLQQKNSAATAAD